MIFWFYAGRTIIIIIQTFIKMSCSYINLTNKLWCTSDFFSAKHLYWKS